MILLIIYQLVILFLVVKKPTPIYSKVYGVLLVLLIVLVSSNSTIPTCLINYLVPVFPLPYKCNWDYIQLFY